MSTITILIIRHAEKPGESWSGQGLTADETPDKKSLVIRGWQRAGSWSALFGPLLGGPDYPQPAIIYAANPDAGTGEEPSQRPFETVTPLADRLGLKPDTTYALGQEPQLAAKLVGQAGGVVLVCWEHKAIANALLPAIVGDQIVPGMPTKWNGERFDVVLRFDRASPGALWSFRQLFPRLLSGDSDAALG
jgi:hypothetical protein